MMTPQEVSQHVFPKASFGGYNMAMVDEFLDSLTEDYASLYKENAVLKGKLKVLVDKIEEYRSTEDAMRMALLSAQKLAGSMVEEAEAKKTAMMAAAEAEAAEKTASLQHELASEHLRLKEAQKASQAFVSFLKERYAKELTFLESLASLQAPLPEPEAPANTDSVVSAAQEIEASVSQLLEEPPFEQRAALAEASDGEPPEAPDQRQPEDEAEDELQPTRRIDFNNLQFGRDYKIK